jgi:hypothetical protein
LQCHWRVVAKFLPPPLCPTLLPLWLLPQPLVDLLTCKHSCFQSNLWLFSYLYFSLELWSYLWFFACDWTCKCVIACTIGCEFPLVSKCAPTCKNLIENDGIARKLHNTKCFSFFTTKHQQTFFNRCDVNLTS